MQVILKVMSGPGTGRRISLRTGQVAQIGRTEWADFAFPDDPAMAEVHFAVESGARGCRLRDLTGLAATHLNGEVVTDSDLHTGDEIRAGRTVFAVHVDGQAAPAGRRGAAGGADGAAGDGAGPPPDSAGFYCSRFELEDDAKELLQPRQPVEEFLKVLAERRLYRDAARLNAHSLPKRAAVWWGCVCLRGVIGDTFELADRAALEAAEAWALEPSEEARRRAESAAEALGFRTAASWVAAGAFWSGGSIAPAGLPEVPPADHLTGAAVSAALMLAVAPLRPADAPAAWQKCLQQATEIRSGKTPWPVEPQPATPAA